MAKLSDRHVVPNASGGWDVASIAEWMRSEPSATPVRTELAYTSREDHEGGRRLVEPVETPHLRGPGFDKLNQQAPRRRRTPHGVRRRRRPTPSLEGTLGVQ